jgi:hypothetical protein
MVDIGPNAFGIAVFDELEKIQSHLLVGQMDSQFKRTTRGRQRAGRILPEPLFVHSDLTTGIQIADLVAYRLPWGLRVRGMTKPARSKLSGYVARVCQLRRRAVREAAGNPQLGIWSFSFITDLRSQFEREMEAGADGVEELKKQCSRSHKASRFRMAPVVNPAASPPAHDIHASVRTSSAARCGA